MRKHKHVPHFTKRGHREPLKNFAHGRRAHGVAKDVLLMPSALERAEKRKALYQHSHARGMDALVRALVLRAT